MGRYNNHKYYNTNIRGSAWNKSISKGSTSIGWIPKDQYIANLKANNKWNDYASYYKSPEWKSKRLKIIEKNNNTCERCHRVFPTKELDIHHQRYSVHVGEDDEADLECLCSDCHMLHNEVCDIAGVRKGGEALFIKPDMKGRIARAMYQYAPWMFEDIDFDPSWDYLDDLDYDIILKKMKIFLGKWMMNVPQENDASDKDYLDDF